MNWKWWRRGSGSKEQVAGAAAAEVAARSAAPVRKSAELRLSAGKVMGQAVVVVELQTAGVELFAAIPPGAVQTVIAGLVRMRRAAERAVRS